MNRSALKKLGRRKAGTYGRTHGATRGNSKRAANKAVRKSGTLKFLDGSPVSEDYQRAVATLVSDACDAEDLVPLDELEEFARQQEKT